MMNNLRVIILLGAAALSGLAPVRHAAGAGMVRLPGVTRGQSAVSLAARSGDEVSVSCVLGLLESSIISTSLMAGGTGEDFVRLSLPGGALTGEIGRPALPMISAVLDVPQGAVIDLSVDLGSAQTVRLKDMGIAQRIAPALESVPKIEGARARFALDRLAYGSDSYYPEKLAGIDDISARAGLARGHRLAAVRFYPVQYNPVTGELRYYPQLRATVRFRGGNAAKTSALIVRDYSPEWEGLIRRLVVNYTDPLIAAKDSILALPIYYDVFYGGTYEAAAMKLADWKRRKGYTVRTWNASGWSAQSINDTILAQSPKTTYLVIISDPDGSDPLPASANGIETHMATDLYYAETNESGYLPDMFNGRISVKTAGEAMIAVDKIIRYEQANFGAAGTAWLKRATLIAGYDDSGFQPICIATNEYCRNILTQHGYDVDTLIMASGEGKARIVPRVNAGAAWTVYSAHGSVNSWQLGGANWYADQLDEDLNNLDMYTMAVGHCCLSGNFNYPSDCFGETWPRLTNKGGVSYFGSVPYTYWYEDDWLQRRYFDAIYDSIPNVPNTHLGEIGRFTQYGLFWIESNVPVQHGYSLSPDSTPYKQYYFEAYHVLGDPAMDFWTNIPRILSVKYKQRLPARSDTLAVTVADQISFAPQANVLVCAQSRKNPALQVSAYADASGQVRLPLVFTAGGDTILITASKHNYRPYLGYTSFVQFNVEISPATVKINVPTRVSLELTDPDSGNAPVDSADIYLSSGDDTTLLGMTDASGRLSFDICARDRRSLRLLGRRAGQTKNLFEDSIRVAAPAAFEIRRIVPNPFRQTTGIAFDMYCDAAVNISVYNLLGQKVRTLLSERRLAGYHSVQWDGKDQQGRHVPAGIYFCRLNAPGTSRFQRMTLIK